MLRKRNEFFDSNFQLINNSIEDFTIVNVYFVNINKSCLYLVKKVMVQW